MMSMADGGGSAAQQEELVVTPNILNAGAVGLLLLPLHTPNTLTPPSSSFSYYYHTPHPLNLNDSLHSFN